MKTARCEFLWTITETTNSLFLVLNLLQCVKIGQYLAKIWKKDNSLLFDPPCRTKLLLNYNLYFEKLMIKFLIEIVHYL